MRLPEPEGAQCCVQGRHPRSRCPCHCRAQRRGQRLHHSGFGVAACLSPGLEPHDSACRAQCSHAYAWLLPLRLLLGPALSLPPLTGMLGPLLESCWRGPGPLCGKGKQSEGSLQGGSLLLWVFQWTGHGGWYTHCTWAVAEVPAQPGTQPGTCTWLGSARPKA